MMIWGALAIPLVCALLLYMFFKEETAWWEYIVPFIVSLILIGCMKLLVEKNQTTDTEQWGGIVKTAEYFEDWDEKVPCRHTKYCTRRNSKGETERYSCGTEHAYDVDYHPPEWYVHDSNGISIKVDASTFDALAFRFKNKRFIDLHRRYHSNDGDKYQTQWDGKEETIEPVTTEHSYENRVIASNSIFKFPPVDPKKYGLYEHPKIEGLYYAKSILGEVPQKGLAEVSLQRLNGILGPQKQVRILVVVFHNQPLQAGIDQQSYWQGGKKNEFVITIGINDNNETQWCHVFSWSEVEILKVETRDFVMGQKTIDLPGVVKYIGPQIAEKFQRKQFKEFSYLSVEPPGWAIALTYILTALTCAGIGWWVVKNNYTE